MRIGLFTDTYTPFINGVTTSIIMLEKALKQAGHEVFIVTVNSEDIAYKYEDNTRIVRIPGIPIGIYDYRLTGIYPLKALSIIKNWNLDIIHSHTEFGVGTFARIIAKQYDIPLVHTYHTMYEDYVHYITKGHFNRSSKKIVEYLTMFYCDKTAKKLIVPSKKTYQLFKEKYKVEKEIEIIPTGMELDRFFQEKFSQEEVMKTKRELGIRKDDFVILFVGRLAKEKNVEFLLESQSKILKHNKKCKLVIAGSGPDYEHFIEYSKKLKIDKSVIFTNAIPWEEIPKYYQVANIFVSASKTETQGLTILEAMAASKPVVCIIDDAFKETVVSGKNGYMFETQEEYVKIVTQLMKDKKTLEKLAIEARKTAEQRTLKKFATQILKVYNSCLDECRQNKPWYDKLINRIKSGLRKE